MPGAAGRAPARVLRFLLSLALLAAAAGCASTPPARMRSGLAQQKAGIASVGVLPPMIGMFEEQARFGLNAAVPQNEWSRAADDAVARVFAEEMAADHVSVVPIGTDDPEAREFAALYNAVDFSIQRHAFEKNTGEMLPREPFDEQVGDLRYSLGPAAGLLERRGVDAVWIVRGFNLLPTPGARVKRGVDVALTVLAALGGVVVPDIHLQRIQLRVALIDANGRILYYGIADDRTEAPGVGPPEPQAAADGTASSSGAEESPPVPVDLRDPRAARHYLRAALAEYRAQVAP
jgi:hypothetical protein